MEKKSGVRYVCILLLLVVIFLIGYIIYQKSFMFNNIGNSNNKMLDLSNLSEYKSFDGTYAAIEKFYYTEDSGRTWTLSLGMDGKVFSGNYSTRQYISNVSDIIDMASFNSSIGEIENEVCYMLTKDGLVYKYNIIDLLDGQYEAVLLEDISNVNKLVEFYYAPDENSGSVWGVMAILNDGSNIRLVDASI